MYPNWIYMLEYILSDTVRDIKLIEVILAFYYFY